MTKIPVNAPVARLVRGDNDSAILRMNVDRFEGGVDLAALTWLVNIMNADGEFDTVPLAAVEVSENNIHLEWLIGGTATHVEGETRFELEGVRSEGAVVWQSGFRVLMIHPDVSGFPRDVEESELTEVAQLIEYVNTELPSVLAARDAANEAAQHPPEPGENGNWWQWDTETGAYVDSGKPWRAGGGATGSGLPNGGKAGQYLRKKSDADGDVEWADIEIPKEYGLVTYDQNKTITIR